jgi:hypothetical protein
MFQGLLREFASKGFRATPHFVKQSFFGGKGGMLFGGLFLFGSLAGPALMGSARKKLPGSKGLLKSIGGAVGSLLSGSSADATPESVDEEPPSLDTTYSVPLTSGELSSGKSIQIVTQGPQGQEKLKVKVPPGSRAGQKLRLRGRGLPGPGGRGDLYVELVGKV